MTTMIIFGRTNTTKKSEECLILGNIMEWTNLDSWQYFPFEQKHSLYFLNYVDLVNIYRNGLGQMFPSNDEL